MASARSIVLVACGSYNPPTYMHLRLFERAKDFFARSSQPVIGGILSPVSDKYGKKTLIPAVHRLALCDRALADSSWIRLSRWEANEPDWTPTALVLDYFKQQFASDAPTGRTGRACALYFDS